MRKSDVISVKTAKHLPGVFQERVKRSADDVGFRHFDNETQSWKEYTWKDMAHEIARFQTALKGEDLQPGDRVAIMLRNSPEWVMFEQAALGLGLVVVPLYTNDRAANLGYIIDNAGIKLVFINDKAHWSCLSEVYNLLKSVNSIVTLKPVEPVHDIRIQHLPDWLPDEPDDIDLPDIDPQTLATIVYTSGTTGNPKGVMLSHHNILWDAASAAECEPMFTTDEFLSFLPLSHMFERTAGYYLPILVGAKISYARSIELLAEDLTIIRPTILITVPRIFERIYNKIKTQLEQKPPMAAKMFNKAVEVGWHRFEYQQGRASWGADLLLWPVLNKLVAKKLMDKLGGRLRLAVSGGAALSPEVARTFIGLGLTISQGYGMTEHSPVVSTNRLSDNRPDTVGPPLPGVEVKIGDKSELLVRSPALMLGYWKNLQATKETIDEDGWLHTGDMAKLEGEHIRITGRIKEIIVLSNGEKIPPADMELAITTDPLFEQVMIVGEGRPFLSALVVLNRENWNRFAEELGVPKDEKSLEMIEVQKAMLERIKEKLRPFPGYAKVFRVVATLEPWSVEAGLITPTLKLKRNVLVERFGDVIVEMYEDH